MKGIHVSIREKDVIVVGGGPSGVCAAVGAARLGAKTLLVERWGFLGGMATAGMVVPIHAFHNMRGQQIVKGIGDEIIERLAEIGGAYKEKHPVSAYRSAYTHTPFNVEDMKRVLLEMVEESGVEMLLHSFLFDAETKGQYVQSIRVINKSGIGSLSSAYFVDATGDGDLAVKAGAEFAKGDPSDGKCMAGSLMIHIGGVSDEKLISYIKKNPDDFALAVDPFPKLTNRDLSKQIKTRKDIPLLRGFFSIVKQAKEKGDLHPYRNQLMLSFPPAAGEVYANVANVLHLDGSETDALTKAEIETRKQVPGIIRFFRKYVPGFENCHLIQTAPQIGIRESRRIIGDYLLTLEEALEGTSFEDSIARGAYPSDIHTSDGGVQHTPIRNGSDYGIPFRCLLPKGIKNVLVGGRCISADRGGLGTIRHMAQCMATGHAAGVAAGLCARLSLEETRELQIEKLRAALIEQGAIV